MSGFPEPAELISTAIVGAMGHLERIASTNPDAVHFILAAGAACLLMRVLTR